MNGNIRVVLAAVAAASLLAACQRSESPPPLRTSSTREPLPAPEALTDTFITGKIRAAVITDPNMAGSDVSVNSDHGVVSLAGTVRSQEQAAIASAHAEHEDGVMRVENTLVVQAD